MKIEFELNGKAICLDVPGDLRVVDLLREDMGLTGTKEGCGTGECGACTILVDGRSRLSCLMLAAQLAGRRVITIEGLAQQGHLHPVQASFVEKGAVQCGFCTPGMVLTTVDLLSRHPHPGRKEIARAISGNLCRCTGYKKIIDAVESVEEKPLNNRHTSIMPEDILSDVSVGLKGRNKRHIFLPQSLNELWQIFAEYPGAKVFGGGTDLFVWMRSRRIDPETIIGLERIDELCGVYETADGVRIGAATTHEIMLENPVIKSMFPVLTQALKTLGSPHIRHVATIGGNIMTASPAGDTLPPLYVLGAKVELLSAQGLRCLPLDAFIRGPGQTVLETGEILSAVIISRPSEITFQYFEKVGLRDAMACAVASLAAVIGFLESGRIESARFAWGSVGPTVIRLPEIESVLVGQPLDKQHMKALIPLVRERLFPITDIRAGADYRRLVAGNLLLRLPEVVASS
ncbi:MAG: FAD binding domain-containing protein [Proteobacteria bacterium]|nr:FAD binding domain-containing protein [Pseudomonadota bacterium]